MRRARTRSEDKEVDGEVEKGEGEEDKGAAEVEDAKEEVESIEDKEIDQAGEDEAKDKEASMNSTQQSTE